MKKDGFLNCLFFNVLSPINRKFQSHLDINKHFFSVAGGLPLNEFIRHFEPAFYQPIILDQGKLLKDIDNKTVQLPFLTKNNGEKWLEFFILKFTDPFQR